MTNQYSEDEVEALGPGFRPDTFDQLWTMICRLPFVSQDGPYAWRGLSNAKYEISSTLYRCLAGIGMPVTETVQRDKERQILDEARGWGLDRVGTHRVTDLQLLASLQHHGVPTRLIDVTANPLNALWFACSSHRDTDGLLVGFNLADYPVVLSEQPEVNAGKFDDPFGFELDAALRVSAENKQPFVVRPAFPDARMASQEGYFIASACPDPGEVEDEYREVPRTAVRGLYLKESPYIPTPAADDLLLGLSGHIDHFPQAIWCIVVPAEMKAPILAALKGSFNRSAETLFPDFAGFRLLASSLQSPLSAGTEIELENAVSQVNVTSGLENHGRSTTKVAFEVPVDRSLPVSDDFYEVAPCPPSVAGSAVAEIVAIGVSGTQPTFYPSDSGRGASGVAVAIEYAVQWINDYGGASALLIQAASGVRSIWKWLSNTLGHPPNVSLGTAQFLAAADLSDRLDGDTGFALLHSADPYQGIDSAYTGEDVFLVMFERESSLFTYIVEANGTLHYLGRTERPDPRDLWGNDDE